MKKTNEEQPKMSEKEIDRQLASLAETGMWQALLSRLRSKDYAAIGTLATLDPFKQPTEIARSQGKRMMAYAIEREVEIAVERRKRAVEEVQKDE